MKILLYLLFIPVILLIFTFFNHKSKVELQNIDNSSILITGGAGFIGHFVIRELQRRNIKVVGVDNFNDYYSVHLKRTRANQTGVVYNTDVCNKDSIQSMLQKHKITHVIHLAAQAGVRYSIEHPQAYVRSNVECFVQLLEVLKLTNIPLVYASSSSVYGKNTKVPFSESDPVVQPVSLYAATKRENELLAHVYWTCTRCVQSDCVFLLSMVQWVARIWRTIRLPRILWKGNPLTCLIMGNCREILRTFPISWTVLFVVCKLITIMKF